MNAMPAQERKRRGDSYSGNDTSGPRKQNWNHKYYDFFFSVIFGLLVPLSLSPMVLFLVLFCFVSLSLSLSLSLPLTILYEH